MISGLKASQTRKASTVSFRLNEAATVTGTAKLLKANGSGGKTSRNVKLKGRRGSNRLTIPFNGLRPGRYRLLMRATDAAKNKSLAASVTFTVPR